MKLIVFDLDGTLTRTSAIDGHFFVQALADTLGIDVGDPDWSTFDHVTDTGILDGIFTERFGRSPSAAEVTRVVDRFVSLLEQRHRVEPEAFSEVPGAASLLAYIRDHESFRAAIATGGWERPARFKCRVAGLDERPIPSAFAEDGPSREAIVTTAIERAFRAYGWRRFDRVVAVGDASWDVQAARALDLPFVGVAQGEQERTLRRLGASLVVPDYLDRANFLQAVEVAAEGRGVGSGSPLPLRFRTLGWW